MHCFLFMFSVIIVIVSEGSKTANAVSRKRQLGWSDPVKYPGPTYRSIWRRIIENPILRTHKPNGIRIQTTPIITTQTPIKTTPKLSTEEPYPDVPVFEDPVPDGSMFNEENPDKTTCDLTASPPSPSSMCCGVDASTNDRIVGGNITEIEHHPWLVQIEYRNAFNVLSRNCGGFLISARYVLSAAHCFGNKDLTPVNVVLGEYDSTNEGPDCVKNGNGGSKCTDGAISVRIEKIIAHPKYLADNITVFNDIAIIRLEKPVEYTKFIRPICLPASDVTVAPPPDLRFTTAGWGAYKHVIKNTENLLWYDGVKRHVDVPFVKIEKCRKQFSFVTSGHICAGGEPGKDSCYGDSGGPLMLPNDGVYVAVGIVSARAARDACGTEGSVAFYTNVYPYLGWIKENIRP